jgi:hypothetical protein
LRKVLLYFGLIILLASLIQLGVGSMRTSKLEQLTSTANSWEVSGNLTMGNTYVLYIIPSITWRNDFDGGGYITPQPVDVVITSPDKTNTTLEAYFFAMIPTSGSNISVPGAIPSNVNVTYTSVDYNSLSVDYSYAQPRFTVKSGGNFTAAIIHQVSQNFPKGFTSWTTGPPANMIFEEEVFENAYSFADTIQISGVMCLLTGAVISAWGAMAGPKIGIKRKTKRNKRVKKD